MFDGTERFFSSFGVVGMLGVLVSCGGGIAIVLKAATGSIGVIEVFDLFILIYIFGVGMKTLRSPVLSVVGDSETGFMLLESSVWAWWKKPRLVDLDGCDGYSLEKAKLNLSYDGLSQSVRAGNLKKADRERLEKGMQQICA